ncbi:PVC-type heme-binding CxxCH protein [Planctellipticum variicoloris]|uniref:PVC-type heme-binding CxxCH protein n=1 Tax=Planctellipticum variicoloris TaxID=3064265 RepID=UPI003013BC7C|nr:c-type cytochrome [Planctomycetaceae bacterium SH412]
MHAAAALALLALAAGPFSTDGNRLAYLDDPSPYYPHTNFPKLVTPQWVGDDGVEAVVILAIDDMREPAKYEAYLRPILQRLKAIDGRAPVSIMTCNVKPDDPQLQTWLQEGLSLEIHTFDHPCPLLYGGDFAKAKGTYDKCVDLLFSVPHNAPVAFRMPCCDSLNTVSPRFYAEIFNKTTPGGKFLQISSSVFQVFTSEDPSIPEDLVLDANGDERFLKYFPKGLKRGEVTHDRFVNYVENYPYPYVANKLCWEFPCMTPSDWEANFLHQPNNPQTVEDLKAALDITVHKQGVLNLVFHPHGWIKAEQVNELIDHAVAKHGKKVKFLTFKEALERLNKNLLAGQSLRDEQGSDNDIRIVDLDNDGFLDVMIQQKTNRYVNHWDVTQSAWRRDLPSHDHFQASDLRFSIDEDHGRATVWAGSNTSVGRTWPWGWSVDNEREPPTPKEVVRFLDIDGDGISESISSKWSKQNLLFGPESCFTIVRKTKGREETVFWDLPAALHLIDASGRAEALRFVDINQDGRLDIVLSNSQRYGVWLFESLEKGWSTELLSGTRGDANPLELPPIVRADGTNNGFFVQGRALHWMNEDTADRPNLIVSIDFDQLLGDRMPAAKTPAAAIKSMHPRPGYVVELMAAEPLVMDPVAMAWGADGKLWVAEMADYPNGLDGKGRPGGRIRSLTDTDGDGNYDKSTLFLDGVNFPNGVFPWKKGVLVSAAPEIFYAEDTDGDGMADRREALYTGFVEGNQQHRVNGFEWGLDGWLYLANGDSGGVVKSIKTGETVDIRGRDLRIHPGTGRIEAVAGQAQFGRRRDDWGRWYGNNNSNPMFQYVYEDRYLSRNPHFAAPSGRRDVPTVAGAAPVFPRSRTLTRFNDFHAVNRFTSASSAMVYRDELLTRELRVESGELRGRDAGRPSDSQLSSLNSQLTFVSEPVHNLVHCEVAHQDGVATVSERLADERQREFLASSDNWFRPTMVTTGPDGAVWIADMYRLVIEHPQWIPIEWQQKLNVRDGDDKGRLWRVHPYGVAPRPIPKLADLATPQLVAALDSPSGWQRDTVQRLLIERGDKAAIPELEKLLSTCPRPVARLQALCALASLEALTEQHLIRALADDHPGVRRWAVQFAERFPAGSPQLWVALASRVDDPDDEVRLQLAFTLGEVQFAEAGELLGWLAVKHPADRWLIPAIMTSLNERNLSRVVHNVLAATSDGQDVSELLQTLIGQSVAWKNLDAQLALLELACPSDRQSPAEWQLVALRQFLQALSRQNLSLGAWQKSLPPAQISMAERLNKTLALAATLTTDAKQPEALRVAAVSLLGQRPQARADEEIVLEKLLQPQESPAIQQAAIAAAGRWPGEFGTQLLLKVWTKLGPAQRTAAADLLLARPAARDALLTAVEAGAIPVATIDAQTRQRLVEQRDPAVASRAEKLFASSGKDRQAVVAEYRASLKLPVDQQRGAEVFKKLCSTCHKLQGQGHEVGPDLAALVDKSPEAMLLAILDPNRAVESKFFNYTAVTDAGLTFQGLLAEESAGSLTLMAAEARKQTVLRADLEEFFTASKSLMPEGLEKDLPPADLANVIGYIRSNVPLPQRKSFPGNEPKTVVADATGRFVLQPVDAEIYGSTLVLEEKYGNLGFWSSADDQAVWTVQVPEAGKYTVKIEWARDPLITSHRAVVRAGGESLTFSVPATASWDDYQTQAVGALNLYAGEQRLTIQPASRPLPALMDLKSVVLERVR